MKMIVFHCSLQRRFRDPPIILGVDVCPSCHKPLDNVKVALFGCCL